MKKMLVITLFMLATLAWAAAQQPGSTPEPSRQAPNAPVIEGCLGGSNPNLTITDKAGSDTRTSTVLYRVVDCRLITRGGSVRHLTSFYR